MQAPLHYSSMCLLFSWHCGKNWVNTGGFCSDSPCLEKMLIPMKLSQTMWTWAIWHSKLNSGTGVLAQWESTCMASSRPYVQSQEPKKKMTHMWLFCQLRGGWYDCHHFISKWNLSLSCSHQNVNREETQHRRATWRICSMAFPLIPGVLIPRVKLTSRTAHLKCTIPSPDYLHLDFCQRSP